MNAYVINLAARVDRWESVVSQSSALMLPINRVEAVRMDSLLETELYVAPGVAATWKSHQFAMAKFLESNDQFALILEDDFLITKKWNLEQLKMALDLQPDFFQLGYLVTGPLDRIDLYLKNVFDLALKLLQRACTLSRFVNSRFGSRLLIREQVGLAKSILPNDIRAGGQAYVVSRKFALAAQEMNTPAFTSADGMFMTLGDVRSFRMFRFRNSLINQTDSVTSVSQRYL